MPHPRGTQEDVGEEAARSDKEPWIRERRIRERRIRERLGGQGEAAAEQAKGWGAPPVGLADLTSRSKLGTRLSTQGPGLLTPDSLH